MKSAVSTALALVLLLVVNLQAWAQLLPGKTRQLIFDDKLSIGNLYALGSSGSTRFICRAQGAVVVPAKTDLWLKASHDLITDPQLLDKLPADALGAIEFKNFEEDFNPVVAHIARLSSLHRLMICYCMLNDQDAVGLKTLTNLDFLDLRGCGIRGACLKEFKGMKHLLGVSLNHDKIDSGITAYIAEIPILSSLDLGHTGLDDAGLAAIAKLERLVYLDSDGNPVTGRGLAQLKSLKHLFQLNLRGCKITAADVLQLKGVPLRVLFLPDLPKSDRAIVKAAFPKTDVRFDSVSVDADLNELFAPLH